jgi:hypothetical protein
MVIYLYFGLLKTGAKVFILPPKHQNAKSLIQQFNKSVIQSIATFILFNQQLRQNGVPYIIRRAVKHLIVGAKGFPVIMIL